MVLIPESLLLILPHCRAVVEELDELFVQAKTKVKTNCLYCTTIYNFVYRRKESNFKQIC